MARAYLCMKISEYPPPTHTHTHTHIQVGICLEFEIVWTISADVIFCFWSHYPVSKDPLGPRSYSWWKCGRRRIPTLYQHRTNATMSTIYIIYISQNIIIKSSVPVFGVKRSLCFQSTLHWTDIAKEILFDWILYVPPTIFHLCRNGSSWVEPALS